MIRKHFSSFLLLFFSVLSLGFLSWSADDAVRSIRHAFHYLTLPSDPPIAALSRLGEVGRNFARLIDQDVTFRSLEQRGLLEKMGRLRVEAVEEENRRLRGLTGLAPLPRFSPLVARVWAREATGGFYSLMIRRGERDGVRPADPVIVLEGDREVVLGQVAEVFPVMSRVTLLTDPASAVSAVVSRTGEQGAVEGRGPSSLALNYLLSDTQVAPGDIVVTAGLGNIFPAGLWIGTVESLEARGPESFRVALLRPGAGVGRVSEVVILRQVAAAEEKKP